MPLSEFDKKMLSTRLPLKVSKIFLQKYCEKHNLKGVDVSFHNHPEVIREEKIKNATKNMIKNDDEKIDENEVLLLKEN